MKNLQSKVAVITGAASGIGRHLALQLAQHGAKVVAADFNETGLRETIELIRQQGGEAFPQLVDVSKKEQIHLMADAVLGKYGQVDILINNAGVALGLISVEEVTYEEMEWIF
ncbi:MAG: SDR family NAD(P)-dependent oxidoreductase, partial [Bacteroidetes bacterium]